MNVKESGLAYKILRFQDEIPDYVTLALSEDGSFAIHLTVTLINNTYKPVAIAPKNIDFPRLFSKNTNDSLSAILDDTGNRLEYAEVKLVSSDNQQFNANRSMLCTRSPVFSAMFRATEMKEAMERLVTVKDISSKGLDIILAFIHTGTLKSCWREDSYLEEVLYGAHKYLVEDLILFLDHNLIQICTLQNCGELYGLAKLYGMSIAMQHIRKYFAKHFEEIDAEQAIQFLGPEQEYLFKKANESPGTEDKKIVDKAFERILVRVLCFLCTYNL